MYELREYQKQAVEAGLDVFRGKKNRNGVIVLPTGSGKSLVVASVGSQLEGHTLVFQPSLEILEQNMQKIIDFGFTDVGVFSASAGRKDFGKITLATIGSVNNAPEQFDHFDNIIIDECHAVNAKGGMYDAFIKRNGGRVLGLTATPYRLHAYENFKSGEKIVVAKFLHRTRPKVFDDVVHVTQVKELYEQGFLCPVEYIEDNQYKHSEIKLNSTGRDFNDVALKKYNEKVHLVDTVANSIIEHDVQHVLVFCKFVAEAEQLSQKLQERGISSATLSAETKKKEREQILSDFKSGKIKVVTNVGVLTTGFDFPELDCVILARPTQSVALYYQMVGRGVRIAQGKEKLKLIDVCGNVARFGRIEDFEIVPHGARGVLRLKSDVSFLTDFDFVGNTDMMKKGYSGAKEYKGGSDVIPFGIHAGTHIKKVPTEYLKWCVQNFRNGEWKKKFKSELERRDSLSTDDNNNSVDNSRTADTLF